MSMAVAATSSLAADAGPRLPDLRDYDCEAAALSAPAAVTHKGQIIEGRYHEWQEIFLDLNGVRRLVCIAMSAPRAEQLSADAARAFLNRSLAIGAPPTPERATTQGADVQPLIEPDNVQPEPLRRVRPEDPTRATPERGAGDSVEAPPIPAFKAADDAQPAAPILRERGAGSPPANYEAPAALGVDDRTPVANTLITPWNTVGYLSVTYPNNESFRCTATLISPYVVLTAGHCVHNKNRGGYAKNVRFYPAQYQNTLGDNMPQRPYGKSDFAFIRTTETWTQISDQNSYPIAEYRHDIAAVQFATPFTFTSTFMPVVYDSMNSPVSAPGYPGVVQGKSSYGQWVHEGADISTSYMRNNHIKQYAIDGSGGNSGGPFFYTDAVTSQRGLVGSLSYASALDDAAGGPWYGSWNRTLLTSWMSWTPSAAAASNVGGLRVPAVYSSHFPSLFSYLRFFNGGTTAGTVEVTLADGASGTVLGTWTSTSIQPNAMLQVSVRAIEAQIPTLPSTKPAFYSISIRPTFTGYFQHAMHEPYMRALTNVTSCDLGAGAHQGIVIGVHTTRIEGYPSSVVVHNTGVNATNVSLGIYDARNGQLRGTYQTGVIPANGQRVISAATLQANSSPPFSPTEVDMAHYVVKVSSNFFNGYLQHLVHNEAVNTVADVTALCRLAP